MSWTPERENKLKKLWKKGHTASQIAILIGDTTRNAVITVIPWDILIAKPSDRPVNSLKYFALIINL